MKIVFSTPPSASKWGRGAIPPVGFTYLAGSVRHLSGVDVTILDPSAEGLDMDQAVRAVLALDPDLFGVSVTSLDINRNGRLVSEVKQAKPGVVTIVGGYHATAFDRLFLREIPELDYVFRGEADEGFPALVQCLAAAAAPESVPGLSFRRNGDIVSGDPQFIRDLDRMPLPDRSVLTFDDYFRNWAGFLLPEMPRTATVVSSRGCPHPCTFCSKLTEGSRRYRARSAADVFEELKALEQEGCRVAVFVDENFSADVDRIRELCRLILDGELSMRFVFQGALHQLSKTDLELMRRAGFDCALVGVESGSDAILKRIRKRSTAEELRDGIVRAREAHMAVVAFFFHGTPGETLEDCEVTKDFIRAARPLVCTTGKLMLFPGSAMWDELVGADEAGLSLDSSRMRSIDCVPGQIPTEELEARIRDFRGAFSKYVKTGQYLSDFRDLARHNPLVRTMLGRAAKHPWRLIWSFLRPGAQQSL